jgi:hypothetical protein
MARMIVYFDYWQGVSVYRHGRTKHFGKPPWQARFKDLCRRHYKRASFYPGGLAFEV